MWINDETADMMARDYDEERARVLDGRDAIERHVLERDYWALDRNTDEAHARGDHTDMGWEEIRFPGTREPLRMYVCYECDEVRQA